MCCTCRAKLVDGKVTIDQNFSLESREMQAGYMLTCQSRARSRSITTRCNIVGSNRLLRSPVKDGSHVSPTIKDPNNGYRAGGGIIHNQIRKHRPELDRQRRQVLAQMPGLRVYSQQAEGGGNFLQYVPGEAFAALGYEVAADVPEIFLRFGG